MFIDVQHDTRIHHVLSMVFSSTKSMWKHVHCSSLFIFHLNIFKIKNAGQRWSSCLNMSQHVSSHDVNEPCQQSISKHEGGRTMSTGTWRISAGRWRHCPTPPARAGSAATRNPWNPWCSWRPNMAQQIPPMATSVQNILEICWKLQVDRSWKVSHRVTDQIFESSTPYLWVAQAGQILKPIRQLCSSLASSGSQTLASVSRASKAQLSGFRMISTWCNHGYF